MRRAHPRQFATASPWRGRPRGPWSGRRAEPGVSDRPRPSRQRLTILAALSAALISAGCNLFRDPDPPPEAPPPAATSAKAAPDAMAAPDAPPDFVDLGAVAGLPLRVPDFSQQALSSKRQLLAMTRALEHVEAVNFAMAGPEILRVKTILDGILAVRERIPESIREKLEPYAERFFLNVGPSDAFTGERIRPGFIPGELAAAAKVAMDSGIDLGIDAFDHVDLGANRLEQLDGLLRSIHGTIWGPPDPAGEDAPGTAAAPGSDPGQTKDTAAGAAHQAALAAVAESLRDIETTDESPERAANEALLQYTLAPSEAAFAQYVAAFSAVSPGGEIIFMGPFGPAQDAGKAADTGPRRFQGLAAVRDLDQSPMIQKLAELIPAFERRIPGNAMFRRPRNDVVLPVAGAYHLVAAAPFGAVTLPAFRFPEPVASMAVPNRVMLFTNVLDAEDRLLGDALTDALSVAGGAGERLSKWRRAANTAFWMLKQVIGFELGTRRQPAEAPPRLRWHPLPYSIVSEAHADLAALHFAFAPEVQALGLVPEPECAQAVLDGYLARFLAEAPVPAEPAVPKGRAVIARRIVVRHLLAGGGVRVALEEGRYVVVLEDEAAARREIERLLGETQRMVSLGEEKSSAALVAEHGGPLPRAWRESAAARREQLGVPVQWTYLYPKIAPRLGSSGTIEDVVLESQVRRAP